MGAPAVQGTARSLRTTSTVSLASIWMPANREHAGGKLLPRGHVRVLTTNETEGLKDRQQTLKS